MKKFILKVLLFFACVVAMDFSFGEVFSFLRLHAKGGSTANCEYIANRAKEDIIILGSSRATHHYVPQIIEDSLGVSCYNCGEEGNGVILAYGRLKMLSDRYKPKLVLFEITPGFDYGTKYPNTKYLGFLRSYYDKDGISDIFNDCDDELSSIKMHSYMYHNTGRLFANVFDNIIYRDNLHGYAPLYGKMNAPSKTNTQHYPIEIDSLKLSYVQKLIELCQRKEIPIVFMMSPWYAYGSNYVEYEPALALCEKYGVKVGNYHNDPNIAQNPAFFQDDCHLNNEGAMEYTKAILPLIKENIH